MKLSILIPSLESRGDRLEGLINELLDQYRNIPAYKVEFVVETDDGTMSIGDKRNLLLQKAKGEYVVFVDDDDNIASDYLETVLEGLKTGPDCLSLRGVITWNGERPELFEHSIRYNSYQTTNNDIKYERYPNHLNVIKADIAKRFKFPSTDFGEDTDYATQIHKSGLLKKEIFIDKVLYHYNYIQDK